MPGCRNARGLDVHHIVHQEHGGGHEDWNLVTLCSGHHRRHHEGLLAIEGRAPDAIRFEWRRPLDDVQAHVGPNTRHGRTEEVAPGNTSVRSSKFAMIALRTQARAALVGLGWKNAIASTAVDDAMAQLGTDVAIDAVIREALRRCPKPTS